MMERVGPFIGEFFLAKGDAREKREPEKSGLSYLVCSMLLAIFLLFLIILLSKSFKDSKKP